ncbi:PIG-L deacetylase family protein [Brevibacillus sp. H7]|uniref:PIG-L deacetylase family protein n=1 Tax=Brevibacillus sp. H7 TaxID=3349138 RepID=UPI00381FA076
MNEKRILFVFAHPDDETFTSGVTIAKYVNEERAVVSLLCATRGQAGKAGDPPVCLPGELPVYRERELREAASILGIAHVDILDYEDKHLNEVPMDELIAQIHAAIQRHQPQIVITFAPHGISGHPDHIVISKATRLAMEKLPLAGSPVKKMYYVTHSSAESFGVISPPYTDPYEAVTTEISAPQYVPQVAQALLAHKTQHLSINRVFPGVIGGDYRHVRAVNHFILAWHKLPGYEVKGKESDLFAGIDSKST